MTDEHGHEGSLEQLRADAESRAQRLFDLRLRVLKDYISDHASETDLQRYLTECDPELSALLQRINAFDLLIMSLAEDEQLRPKEGDAPSLKEAYARFADTESETNNFLYAQPKDAVREVMFRNGLASLRTGALLFRHVTGEDIIERIRRRFRVQVGLLCNFQGIELPHSFFDLLSQEEQREIAEDLHETNKAVEGIGDQLQGASTTLRDLFIKMQVDTGVHPRIAERRAVVLFAKAERDRAPRGQLDAIEQADALLREYSDPGILIDKMLALRGGQLPI